MRGCALTVDWRVVKLPFLDTVASYSDLFAIDSRDRRDWNIDIPSFEVIRYIDWANRMQVVSADAILCPAVA